MRRFFILPENISNDRVILRGSDVVHIRTVLRLKSGDVIHVLDGTGRCYRVCLTDVRSKEVIGKILSSDVVETEPPLVICMGQALLKGSKFDDVVCKAVELGVHSLVPLTLERCIVRIAPADSGQKTRRWQKIALEASKQCGRAVVPVVEQTLQSLETFCQNYADYDIKIVFWENEDAVRLKDLVIQKSPRSIAFVTGPEGGFTVAEVETARRYGFKTVTLGPRILRAETAPIAALAILQNLWGDL